MQPFKNILVAVHAGAERQPVLDRATQLAEQHRAQLLVVDVVPEFNWSQRLLMLGGADHLRDLLAKEKNEQLKKLIAPVRKRGVAVKARVLVGQTSVELVRQVLRGKHDLVMRDAKGAGSRRSGFFGTTAMELLRKAPCAVWLFKPNGGPIERVLAAVNATPEDEQHRALNERILNMAQSVCRLENARLHVAHAWSIYGERLVKDYMKTGEFESLEKSILAQSAAGLDKILQPLSLSSTSESVHLVRGEPSAEIPRLTTEHRIDLLVMGTVARRGIAGWMMGNTAELILDQVQCSVLAVKPLDFVSPIKGRVGKPAALPAVAGDDAAPSAESTASESSASEPDASEPDASPSPVV